MQVTSAIAEARGLHQKALRKAMDGSPLTAAQAQQQGLLDGLLYLDQVRPHMPPPPPWGALRPTAATLLQGSLLALALAPVESPADTRLAPRQQQQQQQQQQQHSRLPFPLPHISCTLPMLLCQHACLLPARPPACC
jgi:ClpP class serine protease